MHNLQKCVDTLLESKTVENIIVRVGRGDEILVDLKRTAEDRILTDETLFDMASVTKIVATTSLALIAIDKGMLSPSDKVEKFFPVPEDRRELTVFHLLTHTMGYGHKSLLKSERAYGEIEKYILSIPLDIPMGSNTRYSCPGFILLGRILESVYGMRLDEAFKKYVAEPLGMRDTGFLPDRTRDIVNANAKEELCGVVNDYNCRYLGGVAGNAGVFSNLKDMTVFAKMLLSRGAPLFSEETFISAAQNYTAEMEASRALGFLYVDGRYRQTGGLFPSGSIGHCGHTGQSVFVDSGSGLYVIVLSDATLSVARKLGKSSYDPVMQMRHDLHAAIKADLGL